MSTVVYSTTKLYMYDIKNNDVLILFFLKLPLWLLFLLLFDMARVKSCSLIVRITFDVVQKSSASDYSN